MINPICDCCKKELKEFGGLAFSPPIYDESSNSQSASPMDVKKYHFCSKCWAKVEKLIYGKEKL
jgi:hypothetical protein